jgi:SAM-dependent methyltransferase
VQTAVHERYSGEDYLNYELANEKSFFRLGKLALYDADISEIEEEADLTGNRRALEIGCATGALLEFLIWRGWEAQGVEISAAEAAYAASKRNLNVSNLPLEENHFPDEYFSLVVASHLIEHLNNPKAFVHEVCRVLTPGGRFLVTTPNISGFQARLFRNKWRSAIFDHLYLFSKDTLARLLIDEGFTIEKTVTWGGIAAGSAPKHFKRVLDIAAKLFGFGDVMLMRAVKKSGV